jgi:hypothetical protein
MKSCCNVGAICAEHRNRSVTKPPYNALLKPAGIRSFIVTGVPPFSSFEGGIVKHTLILTAVTATLSCLPITGSAQTNSSELAEIREQLQALMRRVDKLEQENSSLKAENDTLKSQTDYLRAETKGLRKHAAETSADIGKVKGTDWASRISIKGDLRYRHEQISDDTLAASGSSAGFANADRYRDRIRARLNVEAKATDNIVIGIGMATTEGGDPRSSNQSLDGSFSRKSLDLDLAYFDWRFAEWGRVLGGKMKQPFFKPGQSLFWDGDVNPEGLAFAFNHGIWFASAYNYWLDEVSGRENSITSDSQVAGVQIGAKVPIGTSTLTLGAHYYDLSAAKGRNGLLFNGNANGNTTVTAGTATVLANDFEVAELFADFTTSLGSLPFQLWADVAQNQAVDKFDTAWAVGVKLGAASNYRTWEIGAAYERHEKDSLFGQFVDSDFGAGFTDTKGWVLRAAYVPVKNWTLNATYFINELNIDVPIAASTTVPAQQNIDYDRLQLDFNVKF